MPQHTITLTDQSLDLDVGDMTLDAASLGSAAGGYSVAKRTLQAGRSRGVDVVTLDNGRLRVSVLPTRGMGLWRAMAGGLRLGWDAPVPGPVHPSLVPIGQPDGLGWLAGFNELLCRCGLQSNGPPEFDAEGRLLHGLHGQIANLPAHRVDVTIDDDSGEVALRGVVDESRLFGNKLRLESIVSLRPGEPRWTITDRVTNISAEPGELELLYHVNFGPPLTVPGSRVLLPIAAIAPRDAVAQEDFQTWDQYGPEQPGSVESAFFIQPAAAPDGSTLAVLHNAAGELGVAVRFNVQQLPYFTIWKNRQAAVDGYVTGLEPAVNLPNPKSFEKQHGRVLELPPGEMRQFELTIEVLADAAEVAAATAAVGEIQQATPPQLHDRPNPDWSAP